MESSPIRIRRYVSQSQCESLIMPGGWFNPVIEPPPVYWSRGGSITSHRPYSGAWAWPGVAGARQGPRSVFVNSFCRWGLHSYSDHSGPPFKSMALRIPQGSPTPSTTSPLRYGPHRSASHPDNSVPRRFVRMRVPPVRSSTTTAHDTRATCTRHSNLFAPLTLIETCRK